MNEKDCMYKIKYIYLNTEKECTGNWIEEIVSYDRKEELKIMSGERRIVINGIRLWSIKK